MSKEWDLPQKAHLFNSVIKHNDFEYRQICGPRHWAFWEVHAAWLFWKPLCCQSCFTQYVEAKIWANSLYCLSTCSHWYEPLLYEQAQIENCLQPKFAFECSMMSLKSLSLDLNSTNGTGSDLFTSIPYGFNPFRKAFVTTFLFARISILKCLLKQNLKMLVQSIIVWLSILVNQEVKHSIGTVCSVFLNQSLEASCEIAWFWVLSIETAYRNFWIFYLLSCKECNSWISWCP